MDGFRMCKIYDRNTQNDKYDGADGRHLKTSNLTSPDGGRRRHGNKGVNAGRGTVAVILQRGMNEEAQFTKNALIATVENRLRQFVGLFSWK